MADILHEVGIKAPLNDVYKALATREGLAGWWASDTRGESKLGGVLEFRFTMRGELKGVIEMKVLELLPGKRVLWQVVDGPKEWIGTQVRFELRQEGAYCLVFFRHEGWKEPVEFMYHCSTKWGSYLMSLKALVETGKGAANPNDVSVTSWD